jgi:hypothetical protein
MLSLSLTRAARAHWVVGEAGAGRGQRPGTHAEVAELVEHRREAHWEHWVGQEQRRAQQAAPPPPYVARAFHRVPWWLLLTGTMLPAAHPPSAHLRLALVLTSTLLLTATLPWFAQARYWPRRWRT